MGMKLGLVASTLAAALVAAGPASAAPASKPVAPTPPPRPAPIAPVPTRPADTAAADNVTITSGSTTFRIKRIALTGTKLTDADLAALLDPKNTMSIEARLKTLSAASIEIPEFVADDATAGSKRHWSATRILLANVAAGKAGAGSASGVSLAVTQGGETVDGTLGAVQGTGLDLPQIAHILGAARTDDKEAVLPLGDTFGIETIKLANAGKGTSVALATLKAKAIAARPLRADHAVDDADAGGSGDRPTLFDDVTHSFAAASIEADDFAAAHKDATTDSTFGAKRLFLKDFHDAQGSGGLRETHLDQADLHASFGTIDFDDLATTAVTGRAAAVRGMVAANQIAVTTTPAPTDEDAMPLDFMVAHLAVAGEARAPGDIPRTLAVAVDHLTFETKVGTASARALRDMGYPSLDLSAALAARYDETAKTLTVDKLSITGADMGTATLGLDLANAGEGLVSPKPEVAQASALALLVNSFDLRLANAGFFEKAISWKAKNDGLSIADETKLDIDFFTQTLPASIGGANIKALGAAIGTFIATPKTLHVTASKKGGFGIVDLSQIATPDALLDKLEMRGTAND